MPKHHVLRREEIRPKPEYVGHSALFSRCAMVDEAAGSVHTGMGLCALEAGGRIDTHLHSFEESFYIVEGEPTLILDGHAVTLAPGACGLVPIGVPHAWLGPKSGTAQWIDMLTPLPRPNGIGDDLFFFGAPQDYATQDFDIRDPRSRHLFRMADDDIVVDKLKIGARKDAAKVSSSMATALLAYSGIAVKMLVDERLDAQLHTMFMVEYQPGGVAHPHDHPLEEAYYILDGEVDAEGDGKRYTLRKGDLFWTGVGCVHAFYNTSGKTVRWLETQSPQPPARHSYRFSRDWEYLKEKLAASGNPQ
ncbi:MAG: cupin domain-containing protein [Betaproteobacteria bacterium]|nr:cupin domain-containing protein [Betaproteobacteria bacterium]